jgi:hypothetical protein
MARLVLWVDPIPLPVVSGHARAERNHAGHVPTHLPRDKFSGQSPFMTLRGLTATNSLLDTMPSLRHGKQSNLLYM